MPSDAERLQALERTVAETQVLQAIYGDHAVVFQDADSMRRAQQAVEQQVVPATGIPTLQATVTLELEDDSDDHTSSMPLTLTFPPGYPEHATLGVAVADPHWTTRLQERAEELIGQEAALEIVQVYQELQRQAREDEEEEEQQKLQQQQEQQKVASHSKRDDASHTAPPSPPPILTVLEFHHMLRGPSHKKEATVVTAAATHGIRGWLFLGGPSFAVILAATLEDIKAWCTDCQKAGKPATVVYWRQLGEEEDDPSTATTTSTAVSTSSFLFPNKLKVMDYAPGKDTKLDLVAYKQTLATVGLPYPLPSSPPLL